MINNGSAGMGNFLGDPRGLVTRVAERPTPEACYRIRLGDRVVEAVPVAFDTAAWQQRFRTLWPPGSAAAVSYGGRIAGGPAFRPAQAMGDGVEAVSADNRANGCQTREHG